MKIGSKLPGRLREVKPRQAILPIVLIFQILLMADGQASEKKVFPDWDQGVYAEINRRHGEKAAERMIDVIQFIKVHLNDLVASQLEAVNDYMNEMTWIADIELRNQPDYWATPFETITTFGGDCEDIAIAKYLVLRLMGVPDDHLGFAHVFASGNQHHMVLVYQASENDPVLVLDNQHPDVKTAQERPDLLAVYIFKNDGSIFTIKDEGNAQRSLKNTMADRPLKKWLTAKERSRKNAESYMPFNNGKPLAPDWVREGE